MARKCTISGVIFDPIAVRQNNKVQLVDVSQDCRESIFKYYLELFLLLSNCPPLPQRPFLVPVWDCWSHLASGFNKKNVNMQNQQLSISCFVETSV